MGYYRRLRDCREDHDLTQAHLGKLLGIDQRTYSNYETGKREIPVTHLIALADLDGTSIDYLTGRTDEPAPYPCAGKKEFRSHL